jgi:hypothetical protein
LSMEKRGMNYDKISLRYSLIGVKKHISCLNNW